VEEKDSWWILYHDMIIWSFPEIGGTPKSCILVGFSIINYKLSTLGYPHVRKPPYTSGGFPATPKTDRKVRNLEISSKYKKMITS